MFLAHDRNDAAHAGLEEICHLRQFAHGHLVPHFPAAQNAELLAKPSLTSSAPELPRNIGDSACHQNIPGAEQLRVYFHVVLAFDLLVLDQVDVVLQPVGHRKRDGREVNRRRHVVAHQSPHQVLTTKEQ